MVEFVSRCELVRLLTKQIFSMLYSVLESKEIKEEEPLPVRGSAHFLDALARAPDSDDSLPRSDPPEENWSSDGLNPISASQKSLVGMVAGPELAQISGAYSYIFNAKANRRTSNPYERFRS